MLTRVDVSYLLSVIVAVSCMVRVLLASVLIVRAMRTLRLNAAINLWAAGWSCIGESVLWLNQYYLRALIRAVTRNFYEAQLFSYLKWVRVLYFYIWEYAHAIMKTKLPLWIISMMSYVLLRERFSLIRLGSKFIRPVLRGWVHNISKARY